MSSASFGGGGWAADSVAEAYMVGGGWWLLAGGGGRGMRGSQRLGRGGRQQLQTDPDPASSGGKEYRFLVPR